MYFFCLKKKASIYTTMHRHHHHYDLCVVVVDVDNTLFCYQAMKIQLKTAERKISNKHKHHKCVFYLYNTLLCTENLCFFSRGKYAWKMWIFYTHMVGRHEMFLYTRHHCEKSAANTNTTNREQKKRIVRTRTNNNCLPFRLSFRKPKQCVKLHWRRKHHDHRRHSPFSIPVHTKPTGKKHTTERRKKLRSTQNFHCISTASLFAVVSIAIFFSLSSVVMLFCQLMHACFQNWMHQLHRVNENNKKNLYT